MQALRTDIAIADLRHGASPLVHPKQCQKYLVKTNGGILGICTADRLGPFLANVGFPTFNNFQVYEYEFCQIWELAYNTDNGNDYVIVGEFQSFSTLTEAAKKYEGKKLWWKHFDYEVEKFSWFS